MPAYFYCPGESTATAQQVQCSTEFQLYTPPNEALIDWGQVTAEGIYWGLLYWSLFFIFGQIKKAIDDL